MNKNPKNPSKILTFCQEVLDSIHYNRKFIDSSIKKLKKDLDMLNKQQIEKSVAQAWKERENLYKTHHSLTYDLYRMNSAYLKTAEFMKKQDLTCLMNQSAIDDPDLNTQIISDFIQKIESQIKGKPSNIEIEPQYILDEIEEQPSIDKQLSLF